MVVNISTALNNHAKWSRPTPRSRGIRKIKINKGQVRRLYKLLFVPTLLGSYWSLEIFDEIDDSSY